MEQLLIFYNIGLVIIFASILGIIFKLLKQPLIPAYILSGLLIGPLFGSIVNTDIMWVLAEIGIAFLLFIVGLEIDFKRLKVVSKVATLGCIIKSGVLFGLFYFVSLSLNFPKTHAFFIGLIFSFSSTMVVIKLLAEKNEIHTLHGRILVGTLLTEDLLAVLVLSLLGGTSSLGLLSFAFFQALIVVLGSLALSKYLLNPLFKFVAKSPKLLFLVSLSFCFAYSFLFEQMGFSISIGAFFAGILLANIPYSVEIVSHVKPLRDFFSIIFFAALGMQIHLSSIPSILIPLIIFVLIFYLVKPLLIMTICRFFGYTFSTSFLSGMGLSQVSEFSLIIVALGLSLNLISQQIFTLAILLALITMTFSSYLSKYDTFILNKISKVFRPYDIFKKREKNLAYMPEEESYDTVLVGYNRMGFHLLRKLEKMGEKVLIIDLDPEVIHSLMKKKKLCLYGDVGDIEILSRLNLKKINKIISTVPEKYDNILLIKETKKRNHKAIILVTAMTVEEALDLYEEGADYVIVPHYLGGEHMAVMLEEFSSDLRKLIDAKITHIDELKLHNKSLK
jgi:Kef-type K+ transport system membrane component KefB/Trk K+ transport system NAD-binding subunit